MQPLRGITVVALEQAIAAPIVTRHLADLGARVIKIERPEHGDFARAYDHTVRGMSSHFVWANRSKESLTLDVKQPAANEILHRLLSKADVFVQNLAPGACDRLGLSSAELRKKYPRLIICNVSGYGSTGPYRDRRAYDMLVQSEAGLVAVTGTEETPSKVGISISDIAAGMYAYSGILTALLMRKETGQGTTMEVSLLESIGEWMGYAAYFTAYGGTAPARAGAKHVAIAPYGPFMSADGKQVMLAVQSPREWNRFCEKVLRQPELERDPRFATNSDRVRNRHAMDGIVQEALGELTMAEIIPLLDEAQMSYGRMNSVQEFVDHPQLTARERWREVDSPVGPLKALVPPVTMEGVEPRMDPIPALGEHTDAILRELGFDSAMIAAWRQAKMI
jgi:itaconate CoA-transferase